VVLIVLSDESEIKDGLACSEEMSMRWQLWLIVTSKSSKKHKQCIEYVMM
jgi:hypothetical protein